MTMPDEDLLNYLPPEKRREAKALIARLTRSRWASDGKEYWNAERGKCYTPHHDDERRFVNDDAPRYALARGGEGGGKSVAGIVKTLERLRRGMSGIMVSPDFEHFKRSLWPEFRRWCPWQNVAANQRRRQSAGWEPQRPFAMIFENGASLLCGGIEDAEAYRGPNVHFAYFDEASRKKDPAALKVLDGRARLPGPRGEPPQVFMTTTPAMNWLFDYFGPEKENDPFAAFKRDSVQIILRTDDNEKAGNLAGGFAQKRRQTLSEAEARVLLEAAWEDINDGAAFLPSMTIFDACKETLPAADRRTAIVLAVDGAVTGDTFGVVGVSRHPQRRGDVAVRVIEAYEPQGRPLDYDLIERRILEICRTHNVVQVAYDKFQLHQMMQRIAARGVWTNVFEQGGERLVADKQLYDLFLARRVAHNGDELLRRHVANANRKVEGDDRMRIVKRTESLKIDLVVCLGMAAKRCLELNL